MKRNYPKPIYTGLDTINELVQLSTKFGKPHVVTSAVLEFNSEGYADIVKHGFKKLIIDKDENGELSAYRSVKGVYRKLIAFGDDELHAKSLIKQLYTDPYYHSSFLYSARIKELTASFNPVGYISVEQMREDLKEQYDKALIIHNQIQLGANTFGCAHRFLLIRHIAYKVINLYLSTYENKLWVVKTITKLVYDGIWRPGEYLYSFELEEITKETLTLIDDPLMGLVMDTYNFKPLIESKALYALNGTNLKAPKNTVACIRVIVFMLVQRGIIKSLAEAKMFLRGFHIHDMKIIEQDLDVLRKSFNVKYKELMKEAGVKVETPVSWDSVFGLF